MSPTKIVAIVLLASLMLNAGLQINRQHLVAALKDYGLLLKALIGNFIVVPILGVLLVRLFGLNEFLSIGILLMTIAPGIPILVRAAGRQPGGSLGMAAALAFIMPAISIVTIPLTTRLVFPPDVAAHVPFLLLLITLVVLQLVPLLIGLLLGDRAPALGVKLQRPLMLIFVSAIIALLVIIGPALVSAVLSVYGTRGILAIFILVVLSLVTGWVLGGPQIEYRRTLCIATGLKNIGTCAVIAAVDFPDTLVAHAVLTYVVVQFFASLIVRVYFHRTATPAIAT